MQVSQLRIGSTWRGQSWFADNSGAFMTPDFDPTSSDVTVRLNNASSSITASVSKRSTGIYELSFTPGTSVTVGDTVEITLNYTISSVVYSEPFMIQVVNADASTLTRRSTIQSYNAGTASVTLDASASTVDTTYRGQLILINGELRQIVTYTGATRVAQLNAAFITAPVAGTFYEIIADGLASLEMWRYVQPSTLSSGLVQSAVISIGASISTGVAAVATVGAYVAGQSTITLNVSASSTATAYVGCGLCIGDERRVITAYNPTTKVATFVGGAFNTSITNNVTFYTIMYGPVYVQGLAGNSIDSTVVAAGALNSKGDWNPVIRSNIVSSYTANASTITLDVAASATDSAYVGNAIIINGEPRLIVGYTGSTKVAVLGRAFTQAITNGVTPYLLYASGGAADVYAWRGSAPNQLSNGNVQVSVATTQTGLSTGLLISSLVGSYTAGQNVITLTAGGSSVSNAYVGFLLRVANEGRIITAYNGTTKVATIDAPFTDPAVTANAPYTIVNGPVATRYVADSALTSNAIASSALNGKGDWLLSTNYTVPLDAAGTRTAVGLGSANLDSQLSNIPANVWVYTSRTLTSFGTLVSDIATAVWAAGARTLTVASDSAGIATLLSRITGLLRTKAQDDASDASMPQLVSEEVAHGINATNAGIESIDWGDALETIALSTKQQMFDDPSQDHRLNVSVSGGTLVNSIATDAINANALAASAV